MLKSASAHGKWHMAHGKWKTLLVYIYHRHLPFAIICHLPFTILPFTIPPRGRQQLH
jgi:hypothetical protein